MFSFACSRRAITAATSSFLICLSWPLLAELDFSTAFLEQVEQHNSIAARKRFENWQQMLAVAKSLPEKDQLVAVNDFFNANVVFLDDLTLWQQEDYWATPVEMLALGGGDCEDYSIAKYFSLVELGVDEEKLRLTYVKAVEIGQAHMVLTYYENRRAIPLVLDNLIEHIKPASQRPDLIPVYSFNGSGLWLSKARGEGQRVGDASRISLWEDLRRRMQENVLPPPLSGTRLEPEPEVESVPQTPTANVETIDNQQDAAIDTTASEDADQTEKAQPLPLQ